MLITATELKHSQMHQGSRVFWTYSILSAILQLAVGFLLQQKAKNVFLCADVHRSLSGEAAVEFVVVLLGSGHTAGPVCSGVVVSCLSAFCRGPQGDTWGTYDWAVQS